MLFTDRCLWPYLEVSDVDLVFMGDDVGGLHQKFVAVVVPEIRVGQALVGPSSLVPTKNG